MAVSDGVAQIRDHHEKRVTEVIMSFEAEVHDLVYDFFAASMEDHLATLDLRAHCGDALLLISVSARIELRDGPAL